MDSGWIDAGAEEEFEPGLARRIVAGEAGIAVFRGEAGFVAMADRCPHAGAPLSDGVLRDGHVVCSWHGWKFDVETGTCPFAPWAGPVPVYEVRVDAGRVQIRN